MNDKAHRILSAIWVFGVISLCISVVMHGALLFFSKKSQAYAVSKVVGEHILLGDKRETLAVLNQATSFGFLRIVVSTDSDKDISVGKGDISWWHNAIRHQIYFDSKQEYRAGHIDFYYSYFEGFSLAVLVWFSISFLAVFPIKLRVEKQISLQEQQAEARKNREVLYIVNALAHDLRAPLGVFERILSMPDDVRLGDEKGNIRQSLYRIFSMIESMRRSDVESVVWKAFSDIDFRQGLESLRLKCIERQIRILGVAKTGLRAFIDSKKFERAWINLVSNAVDFAKSEVRIELEVCGADLILKVFDDGPGVSPEILPKLFHRGVTYGKTDGTGLGLAYVRQIMRGHGGDVTYRRENNLTIFECRLPNAVQPEKGQVVENADSIESKLVQKMVKSVAICLEPKGLTQSILAKLTSCYSGDFSFSEERDGASIVVSNRDEIMFEVLERDDQEYLGVAHLKCDEAAILKILKIKFNLDTKGEASV